VTSADCEQRQSQLLHRVTQLTQFMKVLTAHSALFVVMLRCCCEQELKLMKDHVTPVQVEATYPALHSPYMALPGTHVALPGTHVALPETHVALPETHMALPGTHVALPGTYTALPGIYTA